MAKKTATTLPMSQGISLAELLYQETQAAEQTQIPVQDPAPSPEVHEKELPPETSQRTPRKTNASPTKNWQHFTFICDKKIVSKLRAIAKNEGFSIRELIEYMLLKGISLYENKHGTIKPEAKEVSDIF